MSEKLKETKSSIRLTVARNLSSMMQRKKVSRAQMSGDLGIKYTTLCDWINASSSPKLEMLEQLSNYFDVEIGDFFIDYEKDNNGKNNHMEERLMKYAKMVKDVNALELDMSILEHLNDDQIHELLKKGFRFKHKTLEERIAENGGVLKSSHELIDWGEPKGREIW